MGKWQIPAKGTIMIPEEILADDKGPNEPGGRHIYPLAD